MKTCRNGLFTETGIDNNSDPSIRDKRYRPNISGKGIETGDTIQSLNTGEVWKVLQISSKGKALIENQETGEKSRVMDSWFQSIKKGTCHD